MATGSTAYSAASMTGHMVHVFFLLIDRFWILLSFEVNAMEKCVAVICFPNLVDLQAGFGDERFALQRGDLSRVVAFKGVEITIGSLFHQRFRFGAFRRGSNPAFQVDADEAEDDGSGNAVPVRHLSENHDSRETRGPRVLRS